MQNQQQQGAENGNDFIVMMFLLVGVLAFLFWLAKDYIAYGYVYLNVAKFWVLESVGVVDQGVSAYLKEVPFGSLTVVEAYSINTKSSYYYNFILVPVFMYAAYRLYFKSDNDFRRRFSLESLIKSEARLWTHLNLVKDAVGLVSENIHEGNMRVALSPSKFAKKHNLLLRVKGGYKVNKSATTEVFTQQLISGGETYSLLRTGFKELPDHQYVLMVAFMAALNQDKDLAEDILDQCNREINSSHIESPDEIDLSSVRGFCEPVYEEHVKTPNVKNILKRHYYFFTFIYSLFDNAHKKSGVLQSALFLWVKPLDRAFWYVLNNVGRKVSWSECGGVYSHYLWEERIRKTIDEELIDVDYVDDSKPTGISEPQLEKAVIGLQGEIDSIKLSNRFLNKVWKSS